MKNAKGKKPDYRLSALDKSTDDRGQIGVAWKNTNGSISIVLNPWVQISANRDMVLMLFPVLDKGNHLQSEAVQPATTAGDYTPPDDDDGLPPF